MAVLLCHGGEVRAEASREYAVKAAFLVNFAQFVQWPDKAFAAEDAPLVIATVGDDPFEGALERLAAGKTSGRHPLIVRHFSGPDQIGDCHILFIPGSLDPQLSGILGRVTNKPVLSVGESEAIAPAGGCVRFLIEENKMRFEISPAATDRAALKVSSKLMSLARIFKR